MLVRQTHVVCAVLTSGLQTLWHHHLPSVPVDHCFCANSGCFQAHLLLLVSMPPRTRNGSINRRKPLTCQYLKVAPYRRVDHLSAPDERAVSSMLTTLDMHAVVCHRVAIDPVLFVGVDRLLVRCKHLLV